MFKQQVPPAEFDRTLHVAVGVAGSLRAPSLAPNRAVVSDAAVASAVRKFCDNSVPDQGKPVETVVELRIRDYVD